MNIFESFYNKRMTIEEFVSSLSSASDELKRGFESFNPNSPEEYLTQIFTHIMLQDDSFRKAFLEKLEIADGNWFFESEHFESGVNEKGEAIVDEEGKIIQGEMDVFGTTENDLLIIENKIGDRIEKKQPGKYAKLYNDKYPGDKRKKHLIVLAKFSDLMPKSDWDGEECIKQHLTKELRVICNKHNFNSNYIYWYEVYHLLEKYLSDNKIKTQLLEFLSNQNLDQEWCRDIGSSDWRKRLIEAYNDFADKNSIEKLSEKSCGYKLGPLGNNKICFIGSRVQGARSAEAAAQKDKNNELCCFLKLEIKNKSGKKEYIDLSDCCYAPIETIIKNCSGAILEAYGKK